MKNNTASNRLGKLVIRERFEAITDMVLEARTLKHLMHWTWSNIPDNFITTLREAFSHDETQVDMRKTATWEALVSAIAQYESLSSISEPVELEKSPRGTNATTTKETAVEGQEEEIRGTIEPSPATAPVVDKQWHLDDPDWRDERIMQMREWHPHFRQVEWKLKRALAHATTALKEYATLLLSESTDDADDLKRHLDEEVVTYLANKLTEAIDNIWLDVVPKVVRPDSAVWEFEELIEECKKMMVSTGVGV
jgi:hypothetical protein